MVIYKRLLLCVAIAALFVANSTTAQVAIYFSNPLGLVTKQRMKLEYRLDNRNAMLLSMAGYWGLCPGVQGYAEYRNYHFVSRNTEMFYYGKIGGGTGDEHGLDAGDTGPFTYALTGGGMGYHFNMGKKKVFFMDLAFGLKWCQWLTSDPNGGSTQLFYLTGPGSVIDANFHLGFQLGH